MNDDQIIIEDNEIFFLPNNQEFIAYVPLRGVVVSINLDAVNQLKSFANGKEKLNQKFISSFCQLIKKQRKISLKLSDKYKQNREIDFRPTLVALALTTDCNLQCTYCHSNAGHLQDTLDVDIAKIALDIVYQNCIEKGENFEVNFAGYGEPTIRWELLTELTEYIKYFTSKSRGKYILSMATNGVFSTSKAKYVTENFSYVSLSLDGIESVQNYQRPSKQGKGTFNTVIKTARYFWNNKFPFAIRATVSDFSVEKMEEFFTFCQTEFPGIKVGFEALNNIGRGKLSKLRPPSGIEFSKNFIRVLELSEKIGGSVTNSGLGRLDEIRTVFCKSLASPGVTVTPSGKISLCQRDGAPDFFHYGYVDKEKRKFIVDEEKVISFRSLDVRNYDECEKCFCKYHCAGDCQDLRQENISRCDFTRFLAKYKLVRLLEKEKLNPVLN